jgi:phospholipase/carboxylesterase
MTNQDPIQEPAADFCGKITAALETGEKALRHFHPTLVTKLHEQIGPHAEAMEQALENFRSEAGIDPTLEEVRARLIRIAELSCDALRRFCASEEPMEAVNNFMRAARSLSRAQETLFVLCDLLAPANDYFLEAPFRSRDADSVTVHRREEVQSLLHVGTDNEPYTRGAYSVYVPDSHDIRSPEPLVVALHGGYGHGRDFLWMWLREARSRNFLLLSPSSLGGTWSLHQPEIDAPGLRKAVEFVMDRWRVDPARILLTGISDGGTYALAHGLGEEPICTAVAPVAAALPPVDPGSVRGRRVLWLHGAHDWMFHVDRARQGCSLLEQWGADVTLEVVPDLAHTYPREKNDRILTWFDPGLAIPHP